MLLNKLSHCWQKVKEYFFNMCTVTSMHGFRYIVAKNLSLNERRVWAAVSIFIKE